MNHSPQLMQIKQPLYQRLRWHISVALCVFSGVIVFTPLHGKVATLIASFMVFGFISYWEARFGLEAIFPLLPWYRFRQLNGRCGQPPIKPPTTQFLRPSAPLKGSLLQKHRIRQLIFGYYFSHPYLWLAITGCLIHHQHRPEEHFIPIAFVYILSHFVIAFLLRLVILPPRIPRRLYLYYCPCMNSLDTPTSAPYHAHQVAFNDRPAQFGEPEHPETAYYFYQK